jgi:hypothetical protein
MILSIPGSLPIRRTGSSNRCVRAWEFVENKKHTPRTGNQRRNRREHSTIPRHTDRSARYAASHRRERKSAQRFSMETSNIAGMKQLTKCLVYAAIDTCTREAA